MSATSRDRLSHERAALLGRIGAYVQHSRYDARETTAKARQAFLDRFLDEVDPHRVLPEPERLHRAKCARKAHFARLALRSVERRQSRRQRATVDPVPLLPTESAPLHVHDRAELGRAA